MGSERTSFIRNQLLGLSVTADFVMAQDSDLYGSVGTELAISDMFYVRAGSHFNHDTAGLGFGLGLKYGGLKIDYSLSKYGDLGTTGQFGIGVNF